MFKTFKITGVKYGTEKIFPYEWDTEKRHFNYAEIERKEIGVFKFPSLTDAEIFLIANYPEYYFSSFIQQIDGTDFSCEADVRYYEVFYNTSDRSKIIEKITENLLKQKR